MIMPSTHEITDLLQAWSRGDDQALESLTALVYEELHRAAKRCMSRERGGHTLQTTALINELYTRMIDLRQVSWQNRAHFFAVCAPMMRRILTDFCRSRHVPETRRRRAAHLAGRGSGGGLRATPRFAGD